MLGQLLRYGFRSSLHVGLTTLRSGTQPCLALATSNIVDRSKND